MAELRRVEPTDLLKIPAGDWNAAMRQVEAAHGQRHGMARQAIDRNKDGDNCLLRNETGMDLDRFSVVGLSEPIILPSANLPEFKRQVTFRGVVPNESHFGRFAVLLAPCAAGAITEAAIAGVTWAWLQIDDPLDGCADVLPGSTDYLVTSPQGSAQVLWRESDTGVCWAAIRFGTICSDGDDWSDSSYSDLSDSDDSSFSDDSSTGPCQGITETVDVLIPEPTREGDSICFPKLRLRFCDGLYVGSESAGKTCVYVCCDDSSSSWDDYSETVDESSVPIVDPSDTSGSPEDSSILLDDSSSFDDSVSDADDSSFPDDSSLIDDSWSDSPVFDDPAIDESDSWLDQSLSDDSSSSSSF